MIWSDWYVLAFRMAALSIMAFFQGRIVISSLRGKIRNADILGLFVGSALHSVYWAVFVQIPTLSQTAVNLALWFVIVLTVLRFLNPAYAKYALATGVAFITVGRFSDFVIVAVAIVCAWFFVTASAFYLRSAIGGGLLRHARTHVRDGGLRRWFRNPSNVIPHVFVLAAILAIVRIAQSAIVGSWWSVGRFSPTDFAVVIAMCGVLLSWGAFSLRNRFVTDSRAKRLAMAFVGFVAAWFAVDWQGGSHFTLTFARAIVAYAGIWAIRSVFGFYADAEGAKFVDYRALSPGDRLDRKFLSQALYDYQYEPKERKELIDSLPNPIDAEWKNRLVNYVERALESAVGRKLP